MAAGGQAGFGQRVIGRSGRRLLCAVLAAMVATAAMPVLMLAAVMIADELRQTGRVEDIGDLVQVVGSLALVSAVIGTSFGLPAGLVGHLVLAARGWQGWLAYMLMGAVLGMLLMTSVARFVNAAVLAGALAGAASGLAFRAVFRPPAA